MSKITGAKVIRTRHLQTPIRSPFSYNINDKIVVVSNAVKTQLISQGVQEHLIETVYTGVDTEKFIPNFKKKYKGSAWLACKFHYSRYRGSAKSC